MTKSLPTSGVEIEMAEKYKAQAPPILLDWEHAEEARDERPKIGFE